MHAFLEQQKVHCSAGPHAFICASLGKTSDDNHEVDGTSGHARLTLTYLWSYHRS